MATSGRAVCDEELQMGLRLSPVRVNDVDETKDARFPGLSIVVEEEDDEQEQALMHSPCPADRREPWGYGSEEETYDDDGERSEGEDAGCENGLSENGLSPVNDDHVAPGVDEELDSKADHGPEPSQLSPLRNSRSAGNRGFLKNERLRSQPGRREGHGVEDQTSGLKSMRSLPVRSRAALGAHPKLPSRTQRAAERPRSPARTSLDDALLPKREDEVEPEPMVDNKVEEAFAQRRDSVEADHAVTATHRHIGTNGASHAELPRPGDALPPKSPLAMSNIAAKLAASEKEADAARVRAKLRAARGSTRGVSRPVASSLTADNATASDTNGIVAPAQPQSQRTRPDEKPDVNTVKRTVDQDASEKEVKPEKRKRDPKLSKTASRRRSTLSPWELETLMTGNAA